MATEHTGVLTPFQLALAKVVLDNKPEDVSVRGYITALRANIGNSSESPYQEQTYIDGVEHWRSRCTQLQCEKMALSAEVAKLQIQNEELALRSNSLKRKNESRKSPVPSTGTQHLGSKSTKRPKRNEPERSPLPVELTEDAGPWGGSDVLNRTSHEPRLLDQLYPVYRYLSQSPRSPEDTGISVHLIHASDILASMIDDLRHNNDAKAGSEVVLAVGRSIRTMLYAIQRLDASPDEPIQQHRAMIVYSMVSLLEKVLECISAASLQRAQLKHLPNEGQNDLTLLNGWPPTQISKLLMDLILGICQSDALSRDSVMHREVFEGLCFLVVQRTGACLSALTFGRRTDDSGKTVAIIEGTTEEIESRAFSYEAMHIGQLMERIVQLSPAYLSPPDRPMLATSKAIKPRTRTDRTAKDALHTLHPLIRNKLQRTLKECMFPTGEEHHDEFMERLHLPRKAVLKEQKRMAASERSAMENDTPGWFMDKVWCAVGWQLLRYEED